MVRTRFWAGLNSPEAPLSGSGSPAKNRFLGLGIGFKFPVLKLQINWEFHLRYFLSGAHWLSNISRGSDSKKSSPRRRNTIFLRFSQQLPRVRVGLWKGFLSWQGPSTRLTPCMVASRTTEKRGHRCAFVEYVCTCFCYSKTWEGQGLLCPSVRPSASPPPSCVHYNQS